MAGVFGNPMVSKTQPLSESLRQVADDMAKQAKLALAAQAIPVRQMNEIAAAELRDVAALKAKHLGQEYAAAKSGDDMGDMIICDNYSRENVSARPAMFPWLPIAAAVAGVGLGGVVPLAALLLSGALTRSVSTETHQRRVDPQEFKVDIWTENLQPKFKVSPVPLSK
jgi:hypothetical protein